MPSNPNVLHVRFALLPNNPDTLHAEKSQRSSRKCRSERPETKQKEGGRHARNEPKSKQSISPMLESGRRQSYWGTREIRALRTNSEPATMVIRILERLDWRWRWLCDYMRVFILVPVFWRCVGNDAVVSQVYFHFGLSYPCLFDVGEALLYHIQGLPWEPESNSSVLHYF